MSVLSDKNCDVHLHAEIEVLKQALAEKQSQLIAMETACLRESDRQVELEDSIIAWQDKYDRLYESHKRVQKVNQNLEDKLLKLVDRNSGERAQLTSDVATLSVRLAQANYNITNLQREIERYKTDISLAIQLLQCKPDSFVSQKITSLPVEIQSKVTSYMRLETNSHSDSEGSTTGGGSVGVATSGSYRVVPASDSPPPLCPFPPTAMVYSMRGIDATSNTQESINDQMISPSVMAKFLEDELKLNDVKHCDSCQCTSKDLTVLAESAKFYSIATQTILHGDANNSLCLRCNSNLNSPSRTNSPYIMKLVKSSDSVISETKSSVSNSTQNDKLFTPVKKDDLMVNPILGHHRLCDRNVSSKPIILESIIPIKTESIIDIDVENQPHKNIPMTASNLLLQTPEIRSIDIARTTENFISSGDGIDKLQNGSISRHGTATGSTNSLWSKTSSSEGHKMFETFNRNLIKTIKSENPKISGPRLCSLRIQNGSTNILLDSTEPNLTPIVYTRRSKFLDEELDDNRDIITTATSTTSRVCDTQISMVMGNGNKTDSEKCREVNSKENSIIVNSNNIMPQLKDAKSISANNSISNLSINKTAALTSTTATVTAKQRLEKLESDINSSKNANSCTQSSSISSDVDMQESALLRRQQLTRVAEWVQNNSQLDNIGPPISQNSSMEALSIVDSEYNKSKLNNNNNINNDIASEKINLTALASTAVITNVVITSSNAHQMQFKSTQNEIAVVDNNDSHGSDQLTICTTSLCDDNKLISNNDITIAQNIITKQQQLQLQQTYFENGNNDNDKNDDRTDKGNVDLAQMEYNVKQFLLKQNEWSIHNKHAPIVKAPHRTETNL